MLRNLWYVVRHFKVAFTLNVLGLAIAFAAFMMIMMQVRHDQTFDTCYADAEAIFRLDSYENGSGQAIISRPLARAFSESSPAITAGCITQSSQGSGFWGIDRNGTREKHTLRQWEASPQILEVFGFEMTEGDRNALDAPWTAVIPESMARRLFGDSPATGQILHASDSSAVDRTITGVYKDFPRNSSLKNIVYLSLDPKENYDNWSNWNYSCFVRLASPSGAEDILKDFKENNPALLGEDCWTDRDLELHSLPDLHFKSGISFDYLPKADRGTTGALIAIAFVIILIAGINFTNFSTALSPMRIKGINTRKVFGRTDTEIRCGLVGEITVISVVAFMLSLLVLYLAGLSPLRQMLDCDMDMAANAGTVAASLGIAIVLGILSGLYPAFYMTSFPPALVLKGSFGLSASGRRLRSILVGVQFTASFVLIITAAFMYLQNRFMMTSPLGFDKDQIIVTDINTLIRDNPGTFTDEMKKIAGVEDVAFSQSVISAGDFYMTWGMQNKGKDISFTCLPASVNLLGTMGIEVSDGRDFVQEDLQKDAVTYIFNETARKQYGLEVGENLPNGDIVGFIPDINFASLRQDITPMAFMLPSGITGYFGTAYIRVGAGSDLRTIRQAVENGIRQFDPEYPFNVRFYDTILEDTYQKEQRTGSLITLFSIVAIFISIVGVFSLVVFDCEYRRKETAVRKVLGSTGMEIIGMFCRSYLWLLLICFVIGAPAAWYAADRWLESFAYRTPMHWWVFPLAFVAVAAVTLATVTWQSWRMANENPVKNLRSE